MAAQLAAFDLQLNREAWVIISDRVGDLGF
jgi:hypothetical protein